MQHSLCSLNTTKNYKNLSNIFSSVIFKKIVTFVGVLVVDIHWGGLLVSDLKTLTISLAVSRTVPRTGHDTSSRMADPELIDRLKIFLGFDCIVCIHFNCCQHIMFIQFVIYLYI